MSFFRKSVLSLAVVATTLAAIPAEAGDRWRDHRHYGSHDNRDGDLVAAGIIGLALGALAVEAIASSREEAAANPLRHPRPRPSRDIILEEQVFEEDAFAYDGPSLEHWSRSWFRYCQQRYRSFDPQTGTYVGHDGRAHFCDAG